MRPMIAHSSRVTRAAVALAIGVASLASLGSVACCGEISGEQRLLMSRACCGGSSCGQTGAALCRPSEDGRLAARVDPGVTPTLSLLLVPSPGRPAGAAVALARSPLPIAALHAPPITPHHPLPLRL